MTINLQNIEKLVLKGAAIAAAVCSALTSATTGLPANYRTALVAIAGVIYAVERVLTSTTSPPTTPLPVATISTGSPNAT